MLDANDIKNNLGKNNWSNSEMFQLRDLFTVGGQGACSANNNGFNCSLGTYGKATHIKYGASVGGVTYDNARTSGFKISESLSDNYFRFATWVELSE